MPGRNPLVSVPGLTAAGFFRVVIFIGRSGMTVALEMGYRVRKKIQGQYGTIFYTPGCYLFALLLRGLTRMEDIFRDISKYYAANIHDSTLVVGKIIYQDDGYQFIRDDIQGPFNLVDPTDDVTRMVHVIGEIHPRESLEKIIQVDVSSCLYLNENADSGEIEVRSIHKGMGTAIYSNKECPLILWNPNYKEHLYFDVMDIQNVFGQERLKNSFANILAESLREYELFPPLVHIKK